MSNSIKDTFPGTVNASVGGTASSSTLFIVSKATQPSCLVKTAFFTATDFLYSANVGRGF